MLQPITPFVWCNRLAPPAGASWPPAAGERRWTARLPGASRRLHNWVLRYRIVLLSVSVSSYVSACLCVCLVTLLNCGQTVGLIKMPLALDGAPGLRLKKGGGRSLPVFGPCMLWPNGWMDQDVTWYRGRPRSRWHCVRSGPSSSLKGAQKPPLFGPCLLWSNGWMDQDITWYGGRPRTRPHCVWWGFSSPTERGTAPPTSRPCLLWQKPCLLWQNGRISASAELL